MARFGAVTQGGALGWLEFAPLRLSFGPSDAGRVEKTYLKLAITAGWESSAGFNFKPSIFSA